MAHAISIRANGFAEMAYVGAVPWHGLGQSLKRGASIDEWRIAAGLNWTINRSPVKFQNGILHDWDEHEVLYRSDTNAPLSIVSNRYKIVQPAEVLEFFKDLVADAGFEIETAGTLKGGKRIWALARTGIEGEVVDGDNVKTYLLLVTSCDGGLATTAFFTSIRVVCMNTLQMSLNDADVTSQVKVRHNTTFDPEAAKITLGLNAKSAYTDFMKKMQSFSNLSLSTPVVSEIIETIFAEKGTQGVIRESKGFKTVMQLFGGAGKGSTLDGVAGTGWGLVNAMTEYVDHHVRAASQDNRLNSAWFGPGANLKSRIVELVEQA